MDIRHYCRLITLEDRKMVCPLESSWSFSKLNNYNITVDELIRWNIPLHLIEQYAAYLIDTGEIPMVESTICNCTSDRIGQTCQYESPRRMETPAGWLSQQLGSINMDSQETLTLFVDGITCEGADDLLEWRHICDGIIQCQNGMDEFDCHLLEFHQCERDEYQCRNGMCIPIEFVFDAMPDCMDSSDEQELEQLTRRYYDCATRASLDCDDRLCRKDQFSCGNGNCIRWSAVLTSAEECPNLRHLAYLCETSQTLVNRYKEWFGICRQTTPSPPLLLSNRWNCSESLRHLLNARSTLQTRELAFTNIINDCSELILYSDKHVLSPNLKVFYKRSRIELFYKNTSRFHQSIPRSPHLYCFTGQLACPQMHWINLSLNHCLEHEQFQELILHPFPPISHLLCQTIDQRENNSHQHTSLPPSSYECRGIVYHFVGLMMDTSTVFMAMTRETITMHYAKLGNGVNECADGSDEISHQLRWSVFLCDVNENFACWVLQGDRVNENRIKDVRLSFVRYCDSVWDMINGRDEMNCSSWICDPHLHQCHRTGQCIDPKHLCDGEFDCADGEDERNCPSKSRRWSLEEQCDQKSEYFCITHHYLQNRTFRQPCIPFDQVGDGQIDCIGARDERNVLSCPGGQMLGDRFMCDNQNKCLQYTAICNGIVDCADRTDESICFWNRTGCPAGHFMCDNSRTCKPSRCSSNDGCPNRAHWFWCPNSTATNYHYRSGKEMRSIDNKGRCYSSAHRQTTRLTSLSSSGRTVLSNPVVISRTQYQFCNRGFYLLTNNRSKPVCFCSESFYGDRCQFSSRRVAVRLRFDRWHRFDLPVLLNVLVMLVQNDTEIVDHRFFSDENKEYPTKNNVFLLYPRPKPPGFYSVRIEAYHANNHLLHFWEYPISPLDFLPVVRVGKVLRFPDHSLPRFCAHNHCKNNGTCHQGDNDRYFCLCPRHWKGPLCENRTNRAHCAPKSLARTEKICVCPYGYLQPHCFLPNRQCQQARCPSNEICFPLSNLPLSRHICVRNTSTDRSDRPVIIVHRQTPNELPFLIQLLQLSHDYPFVRQQLLIKSFSEFPLIRTIKTRDVRAEMGQLPEIALLFRFEQNAYSIESTLYLLFINCSNAPRNYTVDLDSAHHRCDILPEHERHSIQMFRRFCLNSTNSSCFLSSGYLCYCHIPSDGQSNCLSYMPRQTSCPYCHNQGHCVQGDLTNRSDFACVCTQCVSGILCQFSQSRFSISLEFLIEKLSWGRWNFIGPMVFLLVGILFNGLSLITFGQEKIRRTSVGLHLFANCILSQLVLVFLCARIIYLDTTRRLQILPEISTGLCKSLPFLMYSFYYVSLWLMAFITVERAAGAISLSCWSALQKRSTAISLIVLVSVIIFGSNFIYIYQYKLVSHLADSFPWCIREIQPNEQLLTQSLSLVHRLIPFLINIFATLTIIIATTRSKAHVYQKTTRSTLISQARKRVDLLLGSTACFLTQVPEIVILFLNSCDYIDTKWFVHVTLLTYYLSLAPHFSLFFLYLLPSKLYRDVLFKNTSVGARLHKMLQSWSNLIKH